MFDRGSVDQTEVFVFSDGQVVAGEVFTASEIFIVCGDSDERVGEGGADGFQLLVNVGHGAGVCETNSSEESWNLRLWPPITIVVISQLSPHSQWIIIQLSPADVLS